jgi:DNA mismatch repair ATPase MutS
MLEPKLFYQKRIEDYTARVRLFQKRSLWVSGGRLASFLLILLAVYLINSHPQSRSEGYLFLTVTVITFIILLRLSLKITAEKKLAGKMLFINNNEINVLENVRNGFPNGDDRPEKSIYTEDLDILGEGSLYHYLNRTTTAHGAERLSALLNNPFTDSKNILSHQGAVRHLAGQPEPRQMITARGLLREESEGSIEEISSWIMSEGKLLSMKWLNIVRFIWPVITVGSFIYYLDSNNPVPVGLSLLLSWSMTAMSAKYVQQQHVMIGRKQSLLSQYASILNEFDKTDAGNAVLLKELKTIAETGKMEIKKLSRLTGLLDQRLNLVVNFFLNSLFLYEIHCMIALEKWKHHNRTQFRKWIYGTGEIEMLNSLATYAFNHPSYCFPELDEQAQRISATQMAHPLIPGKESIPNDLEMGARDKLLLITGSNMSGKSTFLRTTGINLVLAQCGAPVCATKFLFSPMRILSSIRISDSLQEHTSFFMAELKRLKEIVSTLETGQPALVLIDEVLRGTNSNDKTHGSEALIKKLIGYNCLSLFATHDLTLSKLEIVYPDAVENYCFESRIENDELIFDYKLKHGVAKNKNATFLMQKMGIIEG